MTIRQYRDQYAPTLSDLVIYAGEYLELVHGLSFLQHFGSANCVDMATGFYVDLLDKDYEDGE